MVNVGYRYSTSSSRSIFDPVDSPTMVTRVPRTSRAHYALRTFNGTIDSNPPLTVLNTYGPSVAHESNDVEDPLVRLTSVNGTIHLTR